MEEESAKHFTLFTAKYCPKTLQEQLAIWSIFVDMNRLLSSKLPDKDGLSI